MTRTTVRSACILTLATLMLVACVHSSIDEQEGISMATKETLWQMIEAIERNMPLTKEGAEQALGTSFQLAQQDQYSVHWISEEVLLDNGARISNASLVLGAKGPVASQGITLNLTGECITRNEVKARYGEMEIVGHPRGHSLQEATSFGAAQLWGELIFAFREIDPDCLAYVTFRPS